MNDNLSNYHNLTLRSEKVQSVISSKPTLLEKWSLLIFVIILLLLIGACWIVRYPDTITARGTLNAENGPKENVLKSSGHLEKLFVQNAELVQKDEALGWIEYSGSHEQLLDLSARLDSGSELLRNGLLDKASRLYLAHYDALGEIQQKYQEFKLAWQSFNDYLVNGFITQKK